MKKLWKRVAAFAVSLGLVASSAAVSPASEAGTGTLSEGDVVSGFTLNTIEESSLLNAEIYSFTHEYSGAELVYVKNSDPEVAFSIGFKTPYVDETDTNHVFEHAILASSEKYPGKDVYFDLDNKGYTTFVNASTNNAVTMYPLSSKSEEQLLLGMDLYMSCMAAPSILTEENFFKREALRLELNDPSEEITINGTVFAEDTGFMTDGSLVVQQQTYDMLYPDEIASNAIGKAEYHYQDLTYEHTLETYERCYHFDNSIIFLYGDLDILRFLSFLDEEYLSKQERYGTDLSAWEDPLTEPGYEEAVLPIPAYEGDVVENNGYITYAIDLQDAAAEEVMLWGILSALMNSQSSPLYQLLLEKGIQNPVSSYVMDLGMEKPCLVFQMSYANEDQMQELKELVQEALETVAEQGILPELFEAFLKSAELSTVFLKNSANVGVNLSQIFICSWEKTGKANYYRGLEDMYKALQEDKEQKRIKEAAKKALDPRRSVLFASIPSPGLAEEHDREMKEYLTELKNSMTEEEISQMVEDTRAFNEWNEKEIPNNDFLIDPKDLPEPEKADYSVTEKDGVTIYRGTAEVKEAGSYKVYFDLDKMSKEDLEYLMIYLFTFCFRIDTDLYTAQELELLSMEYLYGLDLSVAYPGEESGENHRPMLEVSWSGFTEDFETSLELLMDILAGTDLSQHDMMTYLLLTGAEGWDMSRQDGYTIANSAANSGAGLNADTCAFELDVNGQDVYYLLSDIVGELTGEEGQEALEELEKRIGEARALAFTNSRPVFMCVADEEEGSKVAETAAEMLSALPEKPESDSHYELPVPAKTTAICIEASQNYTTADAGYLQDEGFLGRFIPFMYAANDKYTVPLFRFQMGAYSAGSSASLLNGLLSTYTYSDPNVRSTIEAIKRLPEAVETLSLTEEEMNGYILKAFGNATYPQGAWNDVLIEMTLDFSGGDPDRRREQILDIRNATLDDQKEAAQHIAEAMADASIATVGNEAMIRADADVFDEVITYRSREGAADEAVDEAA